MHDQYEVVARVAIARNKMAATDYEKPTTGVFSTIDVKNVISLL